MATLYIPLDTKTQQIRLLHLFPGEPSDKVTCRLSVASLLDKPQYEALSYVWGDSQDKVTINVSGLDIDITSTLGLALQYLRHADEERVLWADAICINQSDNAERNQQVRMMQSLYKTAWQVIAWLEDEHDIVSSFDMIEKIGSDISVHWTPILEPEDPSEELGKFKNTFKLFRFLANSWWKRVWTLQETILAQKLVFQCKQKQLDDHILWSFAQSYYQHSVQCCDLNDDMAFWVPDFTNLIIRISDAKRLIDRVKSGEDMSLDELTLLNRNRLSTDPRDKLFGFLGLCGGYDDLVDYSKSPVEIYTAFSIHHIEMTGTLELLNQIMEGDPSRKQRSKYVPLVGLPTWVPKWPATDFGMRYPTDMLYRRRCRDISNASSGKSAMMSYIAKEKRLVLRGIYFDTIEQLGDSLKDVGVMSFQGVSELKQWRSLVGINTSPGRPYPGGGTVIEAYWRTVCLDATLLPMDTHPGSTEGIRWRLASNDYPLQRADDSWRLWHDRWWYHELVVAEQTFPSHIADSGDDHTKNGAAATATATTERDVSEVNQAPTACPDVAPQEVNRIPWEVAAFQAQCSSSTSYRRLLVSSKGYIGLAPASAQIGDKVCVLYGGRTPYILREISAPGDGDTATVYQFIGDSYVHGLMNGEALSMISTDKESEQDFILE